MTALTGSPPDRDRPAQPLRALIVDDHEVVHWGLKIMLSRLAWIESVQCAHTASEAVSLAKAHRPDIAVIDLFVGEESGPEISEQLHRVRPGVRVLLISGAGQISSGAAAACGAYGFVAKDSRGVEIVRAIREVALGRSSFAHAEPSAPAGPPLSERERQVLRLLATGATNREIAEQLHLSAHTVKEYVSAVYRKLEVRNRAEAVQKAQRLGLIS